MLNLNLGLTADPDFPEQILVTDLSTYTDVLKSDFAFMLAAEYLKPTGAAGELVDIGTYDPATLQRPGAVPIRFTPTKDGVLRLVLVAVIAFAQEPFLGGIQNGQAYYYPGLGGIRVRNSLAGSVFENDPLLTSEMLLGQGEGLPDVEESTMRFFRVSRKLDASLARLNLRYLALTNTQQAGLIDIYERAELMATGSEHLFEQGRYLDCASVLLGAERMLTTGGQTPDDLAPLLSGFAPNTAR